MVTKKLISLSLTNPNSPPMKRNFTTNTRVINDLFAQYTNTFNAFLELINNSIQASAKNISLEIEQAGEKEITKTLVKKITLRDDGIGIPESEFAKRFFDIGTEHKALGGGKGIGRFACLQIGATAKIETVAFDEAQQKYTKVNLVLTDKLFKSSKDIGKLQIETEDVVLEGRHSSYYSIEISDLYDDVRIAIDRNKKLDENLTISKINDAIFTRYPLEIFENRVRFTINRHVLQPSDFVVGKPINRKLSYVDKKGVKSDVLFNCFHIKSPQGIKVFLRTKNAGIDTIVSSLDYDAQWLSPKTGSWFIYVDSNLFTTDMLRNFDFGEMDEYGKHLKAFIKDQLNIFFREKNKEFDDFTIKLKGDKFYPYKVKQATSDSKVIVFEKMAYLVEEKYHLLVSDNSLREIIYPLIDKSISNGDFQNILVNVLKLDKKFIDKFNTLLTKADLEDIIDFSERVAKKLHDVEFIDKIVNSEIAKHISERSQLHKVLEKHLWIFGEQYSESTNLLSDKNLQNNLEDLRNKLLTYSPDKKTKENVIELKAGKLKSITDLFLYSERILNEEKKEVLVVELKAPKVKISSKELQQVKRYAYEIEQQGKFSRDLEFKILLVGSDFTPQTTSEIKGIAKSRKNPYFYYENDLGNIQIWVIRWSDLLENTKRKLTYLSNALKTKDVDVKDKFETDFKDININKISSRLSKSAMKVL